MVYCGKSGNLAIKGAVLDRLGRGGFGDVYKGKLGDESADCFVAVKVLKQSKGKEVLGKEKSKGELELKEFVNEVASIGKTSHVNVVALLGFCFESGFWSKRANRALIFEYMPNGSLDKFIFDNNAAENTQRLDWERCYQISLGIARGLDYLHHSCNKRIVHFDIKPQNILLDAAFVPKICDFGLSKICTRDESIISIPTGPIRGTPGYIAPEVCNIHYGKASYKSDVFSYGMMVVDMVGARRNINVTAEESSEEFFPQWVYKRLELDEELGLQRITNEEDRSKVRKMIIVSLWCTLTDPSSRPTMDKVVQMLEGSLDSLQVPPKNLLYST
ncbi:hypothetical protein TIFTF001_007843 [Ficus carica]|uniref:Protein kinase domain-containing protein n=1 Tax=Ficus carica TaxID=3494 RepID=A0AA88A7E5_FICCA|nr:hypothetical protein TIFTF001_007843 [Ficus carica]